jgi:LacI family transcriptional regulator
MSVKIKDLAKQLNLSVATISKLPKDSHKISLATRQRVFRPWKEIKLHSQPYASSLRKRSSKTIAVALPGLEDSILNGEGCRYYLI